MAASTADGDSSILDETVTVTAAAPRPFGAVLLFAGLAHLLVPGLLLWLAGVGYDRILGVRFEPGERTKRRVRLVGFGMIATGAHLLYYGGIRPNS
ncbi:MAG: hypothetical protein V5A52_01155 [Halovenus sp.]|uniref:hypothetical protein n=1 Tax=Halovenus amylolytica TaxID=2500550 RepID=UPI002FC46E5B